MEGLPAGYGFSFTPFACPGGGDSNAITETTSGSTILRYSGTAGVDGQFIQNWQTPKTAGCYTVTFSAGGTSISADFQLVR